jgi:hypothetical protein
MAQGRFRAVRRGSGLHRRPETLSLTRILIRILIAAANTKAILSTT